LKRCVTRHVQHGKQTNYKVYDIHAHIIPGVDDGATNFNMAMKVIRMAYLQGTTNIVCSSHDGYNTNQYFRNLKVLQQRINKASLGITLHPGCEIYCCADDMEYIVSDLDNNIIPTINGTEYVLVEFCPYVQVSEMVYCLKCLTECRYKPVIAHVERYHVLHMSKQWIKLLQCMGCLFQVNAYSFVDTEDEHTKVFAQELLKEKYISFIGSDAHGTNYRPYIIQNGVNYIYKNCDTKYAKDICYRNAKNILNMK